MKVVKQKKMILDTETLEEAFFEDVKLFGIVSPVEPYHLIWNLNHAFNYSFERNHEAEVQFKDIYYSVFYYADEEKLIEHYIFANRNKTNYMIAEAKNIDFIWMMKGNIHSLFFLSQVSSLLESIQNIDYSMEINPEHLKSKQHLIV